MTVATTTRAGALAARLLYTGTLDAESSTRLLGHLHGDGLPGVEVSAGVVWPDTVFRSRMRRAGTAKVLARTTRDPDQLDTICNDRRSTVSRALADNPHLLDRHRLMLCRRFDNAFLTAKVLKNAGDAAVVDAATTPLRLSVGCWCDVLTGRDLATVVQVHDTGTANAATAAFWELARREDADPTTTLTAARRQLARGDAQVVLGALGSHLTVRNATVLVELVRQGPDVFNGVVSQRLGVVDPEACHVLFQSGNLLLWKALRSVQVLPADVAEALADSTGDPGWLAHGCTPERAVTALDGPGARHALVGVARFGRLSDPLLRELHRRRRLGDLRTALAATGVDKVALRSWVAGWVRDLAATGTADRGTVTEVLRSLGGSSLQQALGTDPSLVGILPTEWLADMVWSKQFDLVDVAARRTDVLTQCVASGMLTVSAATTLRAKLADRGALTPTVDALTAAGATDGRVDVDNLVNQAADGDTRLYRACTVVASQLLRTRVLCADQLRVLFRSGLLTAGDWKAWVAGECKTPFDGRVAADTIAAFDTVGFDSHTAAQLWAAGVRDERLIAAAAGGKDTPQVTEVVEDALGSTLLSPDVVALAAGHSFGVTVRWLQGGYAANPPTVELAAAVRSRHPGLFFDAVLALLADPDTADDLVDRCFSVASPAALVSTIDAADTDTAERAWRTVVAWVARNVGTADELDAVVARTDTWPGSFAELVAAAKALTA
jgi:hypothetical protein